MEIKNRQQGATEEGCGREAPLHMARVHAAVVTRDNSLCAEPNTRGPCTQPSLSYLHTLEKLVRVLSSLGDVCKNVCSSAIRNRPQRSTTQMPIKNNMGGAPGYMFLI